ncbi:MAG: GntR family transcriptional regulator [Chloroflexi bacterium]|nr:GntR family transcriptional regulator [Chloroflexota bacterium]
MLNSRPRFSAQSVSQQISDYLRAAIVQGTIKPNQRLIEESLAQELGVSRTPVREALRRLEAEGLIEFEAQKGARVRPVSAEELTELYELRILLEAHAARLAAQKITAAELDALHKNTDEFLSILDQSDTRGQQIQRLIELNNEFHTRIIQVSGNRHLIRIAKSLLESNALYGVYYYHEEHKSRVSHQDHLAILDALEKHDADRTAQLVQAHLTQAQNMILEAMQQMAI